MEKVKNNLKIFFRRITSNPFGNGKLLRLPPLKEENEFSEKVECGGIEPHSVPVFKTTFRKWSYTTLTQYASLAGADNSTAPLMQ